MNKSQLWQQIKSFNNPNSLKWTSSIPTMFESIQNYQLQQELNTYANFEPYFLPEAEDHFDPQMFRIPNYEFLSTLLEKATENISNQDFPVEWGYVDEHGEEHKYKANSLQALGKQLEALKEQSSEFSDIEVDDELFFFTKLKQYVYVPRNGKRVNKSKKGQGNDFETCNVIDNEFVFCPPSGKCLLDCLSNGKKINPDVQENIFKFIRAKKIFRFNFASCHIRDIAEIMQVKFNIYRQKEQELRYKYQDGQIILCLIDSHWIVLKNKNALAECYKYAKENIVWTDKLVSECSFETQTQSPKYHECPDQEAFVDTWIQDFEAYPDSVTGQFIPYATGFVNLQDVNDFRLGKSKIAKCPTQYVMQYDDQDCIINMLQYINKFTKRTSKEITDKNGKTKKVTQKKDVYIYAHNGANFDSYFYLNVKGIKCAKMVEKGGIMSMTLTGEQFNNANFVIRDTRKFLSSSLASLCKSFKIDEKYCKSSMNHDEVNASNWKSLKSIWSPYLNLDVVSLSLIWISFIEKMRKVSKDIDIKKYCSIAQLSYSVACKGQELPAFTDPKLRQFIQRANRGGRVIARNQSFQTENLRQILENNGAASIDDLVGKIITLQSLGLVGKDYQIAFDATSLYPSAMSLPHASYLDAQNAQYLTPKQCLHFNPQEWTTKKFIIECDLYAPETLQFVPLSIKTEWGAQFSTGNLRNVVVNDVDLFECFRFGYQLKAVHQGIWSEPIQYDFIKDFVTTYFSERAKVKNTDSVLGDLYKLILNSAYGKFGQKRCETETKFTTKKEMENEELFTDNVLECIELGNEQICYKVKKSQQESESLSPHHIAGYILSYSKQIMNNFVLLIGADKENLISYMDTDSFYIHSKDFSKLAHIKDCLGGGKNDYGETKMILKADYLGCKSKVCYLLDTETMKVSKKVTWKGISTSKFSQISQTTVNRVKAVDEETGKQSNDYINDIDNWLKNKLTGVTIQHGCSKKLSIQDYCQKYDLVDGVYNFKHLE